MKKQNMLSTLVFAAFLSASSVGIAATASNGPARSAAPTTSDMPGMSGMMGMHGMMKDCPMMMGGEDVLSPRQRMQMHAEMMRAMGEIMQKYLDAAPASAK